MSRKTLEKTLEKKTGNFREMSFTRIELFFLRDEKKEQNLNTLTIDAFFKRNRNRSLNYKSSFVNKTLL